MHLNSSMLDIRHSPELQHRTSSSRSVRHEDIQYSGFRECHMPSTQSEDSEDTNTTTEDKGMLKLV